MVPEGPSTKTSITGNRLAYVQYVYVHPAGYGTTLSAVVDTVAGKSVAVFFFCWRGVGSPRWVQRCGVMFSPTCSRARLVAAPAAPAAAAAATVL